MCDIITLLICIFQKLESLDGKEIWENSKQHFYSCTDYLFFSLNGADFDVICHNSTLKLEFISDLTCHTICINYQRHCLDCTGSCT